MESKEEESRRHTEEKIRRGKLFEKIKKLKTDDTEIRISLEKYISFYSREIKRIKIEEEELILNLFEKLTNSLLNFQMIKKRLLRCLQITALEKINLNKKKELKIEKEKEIKHMSDIDSTIPVYSTKDSINLVNS